MAARKAKGKKTASGPRSGKKPTNRKKPAARKPAAKKKPARKKPTGKKAAPSKRPSAGKPAARKSATSKKTTTRKKTPTRKPLAKKATPHKRPTTKKKSARGGARARKGVVVTAAASTLADDGKVRLNRFLASAGVASRRGADELIVQGRVTVNGTIVRELGERVDPGTDKVACDSMPVREEKPVYALLNKPKGVVCTNAKNEKRPRAIDCLRGVRGRLYTVGRLDADSEGLILLTNDGAFAQLMAHPSFGVPKVYSVMVRGRIADDSVRRARGGVWLAEGKTAGAVIRVERMSRDRSYLKVTLREGKNREIRRIFARLGHEVLSLKRIRIGGLSLHGLRRGAFRFLRPAEVNELRTAATTPSPDVREST